MLNIDFNSNSMQFEIFLSRNVIDEDYLNRFNVLIDKSFKELKASIDDNKSSLIDKKITEISGKTKFSTGNLRKESIELICKLERLKFGRKATDKKIKAAFVWHIMLNMPKIIAKVLTFIFRKSDTYKQAESIDIYEKIIQSSYKLLKKELAPKLNDDEFIKLLKTDLEKLPIFNSGVEKVFFNRIKAENKISDAALTDYVTILNQAQEIKKRHQTWNANELLSPSYKRHLQKFIIESVLGNKQVRDALPVELKAQVFAHFRADPMIHNDHDLRKKLSEFFPEFVSFPSESSLTEKQSAANKFKVGDILFFKFKKPMNTLATSSDAVVDTGITLLQGFSDRMLLKRSHNTEENETFRLVHATIVVNVDVQNGKVLIAEAMPTGKKNELRVVDLFSDKGLVLHHDSDYEYVVMRPPSHLKKFHEKAAEIAQYFATRARYLDAKEPATASEAKILPDGLKSKTTEETKHKFSFRTALRAIVIPNALKNKTTNLSIDLFHQIADEHLRQNAIAANQPTNGAGIATGANKPLKFFCSQFVLHSLRQAEIACQWEFLKHNFRADFEELDKKLANVNSKMKFKEIDKWCKKMAAKHQKTFTPNYLIQNMYLSTKSGPDDFFKLMTEEKKYTNPFRLIPPAKEHEVEV